MAYMGHCFGDSLRLDGFLSALVLLLLHVSCSFCSLYHRSHHRASPRACVSGPW
jgi:hypothetical protein